MVLPIFVRALRRKARPPALPNLDIASMLPLLIDLSQAVTSSVSRSRRVADGMVLHGARRLQALQAAAPRLVSSLEQFVSDNVSAHLSYTAEEIALVRALIEFFLGWVLSVLSRVAAARATGPAFRSRRIVFYPSPVHLFRSKRRESLKCPRPT